jgi:hypothetical protein
MKLFNMPSSLYYRQRLVHQSPYNCFHAELPPTNAYIFTQGLFRRTALMLRTAYGRALRPQTRSYGCRQSLRLLEGLQAILAHDRSYK